MDLGRFIKLIKRQFPIGIVLDNPGGSTSAITGYTEENITYIRGKSRITVAFKELYNAYSHFRGRWITTGDLRRYAPHIFDSHARPAGHSCNCTFLFMLLEKLELSTPIEGKGRRGNPFAVHILE